MKLLIASQDQGGSFLKPPILWDHDAGEKLTSRRIANLNFLPSELRPEGKSDYRDYGIPEGSVHWNRVRFPPNDVREMHFTNTIDAITVVTGSLWIILDDGEHQLDPGDSVLIEAADHGWRVGPEGCITSNMLFGIPGKESTERD